MFLAPAEARAQGGARLTLPGSFVCLTAVPYPGAMHRRDRVLGFVVIMSILGTARLCQMHGGRGAGMAGKGSAHQTAPLGQLGLGDGRRLCPYTWEPETPLAAARLV